MSKPRTIIHEPTFHIIRSKREPHQWEVFWHLGGQAMTALIHPNDRAYIESNFDVQVDESKGSVTYEHLIIKETRPATAPEKETTP